MPEWLIVVIPLGGVIAAGVLAWLRLAWSKRHTENVPLPPTWPQMWERMEAQDDRIESLEERIKVRDQAFLSILTTLSESWPAHVPKPEFDAAALRVLEDTLPPWYLRQARRTFPRPSQ